MVFSGRHAKNDKRCVAKDAATDQIFEETFTGSGERRALRFGWSNPD